MSFHFNFRTAKALYRMRKKNEFHGSLEDISLKLDGEVLLAVNLNGHIGREENDLKSNGHWAYENENPEKERLHDLAEANSMVMLNILFKKSGEHIKTYKIGGKQYQIDYILTSGSIRLYVTDCKSIYGDPVCIQLRLVMSEWFFAQRKNCKERPKKRLRGSA